MHDNGDDGDDDKCNKFWLLFLLVDDKRMYITLETAETPNKRNGL